jgi:hypothetical protein
MQGWGRNPVAIGSGQNGTFLAAEENGFDETGGTVATSGLRESSYKHVGLGAC